MTESKEGLKTFFDESKEETENTGLKHTILKN